MAIKASKLISSFQLALNEGWGYIWGTSGQLWTAEKQQKINAKSSSNYDLAKKYGNKWIGKKVADCSGLFSYAFGANGGYIKHGSNSIWRQYCTSKGTITSSTVLKPGTAVFKVKSSTNYYHIGLYIGNNTVIEAAGTKQGVITSKLSSWHTWGELKNVTYDVKSTTESAPVTKAETVPTVSTKTATVFLPTGYTGSTVRMRASGSINAAILMTIKVGQVVSVIEEGKDWTKISYNNKTGYMMSKFLQ